MARPPIVLREPRQQLNNLRRDSRSAANTSLSGYMGIDGEIKAASGDNEALFAKSPPFQIDFVEIASVAALPTTHDTTAAPFAPIAVEDTRKLVFAFEYTPAEQTSRLEIIPYGLLPQQGDYTNPIYIPFAYANPTPSDVIPLGYVQTYAARALQPVVFRTAASTTGAGTPIRFLLPLDACMSITDVAVFKRISLTCAEFVPEGGDPGSLRIWAADYC